MDHMTEHRPHTATRQHDYIPAFGKDALLPFYDLLTRVLGMGRSYDTLVAQAELADGLRVLEIGCGTGNVTVRVKRADPGADVVGTDPGPPGARPGATKSTWTVRDSLRARICAGASVRGRRIRSRAVIDDASPSGRRRKSRCRSRDSSRLASRRHPAHRRHRRAYDGSRWLRSAADAPQSAHFWKPRRCDPATIAVGRVRLHRGGLAAPSPGRPAHLLSRYAPDLTRTSVRVCTEFDGVSSATDARRRSTSGSGAGSRTPRRSSG